MRIRKVLKFTHMKTPLWRYTFSNRRIREKVEEVVINKTLNLFCGKTLLDCWETRNDLDETVEADHHMDALVCLRLQPTASFETVLLDPPYSYRKSMEMYGGRKMSSFNAMKPEIERVLKKKGRVITFGYHSVVMGRKRGFRVSEILLMSHGGAIHDTIMTVEDRG